MPYDPLAPEPDRTMASHEFFQMLIMPGLVLLFGVVNAMFFAPGYIGKPLWMIEVRIFVPFVAMLIIEGAYWYFNRETIWSMMNRALIKTLSSS